MPSKYQKYDIATKVSLVEEYLELSKTVKITKADFAYQKEYQILHLMIGLLSTKRIRIDLLLVLIVMTMYLLFLILNHHLLS